MKSATWPMVTIQSIQAAKKHATTGGPFGSKLGGRDYVEKGVPVIRGTNLPFESRFSLDDFVFVSEEKADSLIANNAHPGDVVFTQRGTLGQVGVIPKSCGYHRFIISQSQMKLTVDESQSDPEFIYYYFRSAETVNTIKGMSISAGVPHINLTMLREFPIPKPPLTTQRKIASILSAYDDLIENNTRRIAILEEMAQAIYREWFVNFRFPGHENVKLVDSRRGIIPEGWAVVTLKEMYPTSSGGTPSRNKDEYYSGGTINWVKTKELKDRFLWGTEEKITKLGLQKSSAKVYPPHTVIMAMYGATIGQLGILGSDAAVNQACCAFRVHDSEYGYPFIFLYCLHNRTEIISLRAGAAQQNVSQDVIREIEIARPPLELVSQFNEIVSPTLQQMFTLQKANANLRTTRDLLLPKLISGRLDVEDLDIDVALTLTHTQNTYHR